MARYPKGISFQGNQFVRKAGIPVNYTETHRSEFVKCLNDCRYFIENYVKIKNVDSELLVPFHLRGYQEEIVEKAVANREYILTMPRQGGKTTTIAAVILWYLIFNRQYSILIAAHKGDKARDVLAAVKTMYETLPEWLQHGVLEWNKGTIVLETMSRIRATSTSGTSARGDVVNLCYLDEVAFVQTHICDEFFKSVLPTISSGKTTKVILTSTPRGLNAYHKMWVAAVEGKSGYAWTLVKWDEIPGRTEEFKKKIIAQFGEAYWSQEYAAEFLGSSYTLISSHKLLCLVDKTPLYSGPHINVYEEPQKGHYYVITSDVSEGVMGDYSTAMVTDVTMLPYRVVCVYRNNTISTMALPQVLFNIAKTYNDAIIMVETTGIGQEVANALLHDLEYENTALTEQNSRIGQALAGMFGSNKTRVGLSMNKKSKAIGCGKLKALIESDQLLVYDYNVIYELKRFAVKAQSYAAEEGHDDLVMSLVSLAWMVDQGYIRDLTDVNAAARVAENNAKRIEEDLTPAAMFHKEIPPGVALAVAHNDDSWIFSDDEKYWQGKLKEKPKKKSRDAWILEEKKETTPKPPAHPLKFW